MHVRPARADEDEAVLAVIVARDIADIGRPDYTLEDVAADRGRPGSDVLVVEDDAAQLVAWACVEDGEARVAVHPGCDGRGIGTLLRHAVEARQREQGFALRQSIVPTNVAAVAHLRAAGYARRSVYVRMRAALRDAPRAPDTGVRQFDLQREGAAVHALIAAAFSEIEGNVPMPFDAWHAEFAAKSEAAFRLALDDDDGLVAAAVGERWDGGVGYVARLAVARRARGRGHGRALLLALLDAFRAAGMVAAELGVVGTNAPATRLYESVGMQADFRVEGWERVEPEWSSE
jgi:ribosomal protein S18 acetylase RimI-like enzyme